MGVFSGNDESTTIDFTEYIEPKKWFLLPFLKIYLRKQQAQYIKDLRKVL